MKKQTTTKDKFANWIDTYVIADIIFTSLDDTEKARTLSNAKQVWLNSLEVLFELTDKKAENL